MVVPCVEGFYYNVKGWLRNGDDAIVIFGAATQYD